MRLLTASALSLAITALASCQPNNDKPKDPSTPTPPAPAESTVKVSLKTSHGTIVLLLDRAKAPITVDNFRKYVENKHYDGTVFHRVMPDFMIQGGGFTLTSGQLNEKPTAFPPIQNEGQNGLKNLRGTIAMARTGELHSARCQFFINVKDNPLLDFPNNGGYAVFGKVIEGMDVVDKIKAVPTIQGSHSSPGEISFPTTPIVIESAVVLPAGS